MHFEVSQNEFLKALNTVARAASGNTPMPSLIGIKIEAKDDELILLASDGEISIKVSLATKDEKNNLQIFEKGLCVIDARYILEIARKISADIISLEIMDGTLVKIEGGTSKFKLNGIPVENYPEISFALGQKRFNFKTKILSDIVEQIAFACSDKETRPALTGVNLAAHDKKLHVNATDSYRLASKFIDLDEDLNFNITVPSKHLMEVHRSLSGHDNVDVAIDNQKIAFLFDNTVIETRLIEDAYPDTSRLIPQSFSQTLEVSAKDLLSAIDRASFIKSDGKNVVKMAIDKDEVTITSSSQEIGSSYDSIKVISFSGEPLKISCSGKYLSDAIKAIRNDRVRLSFNGELKPIIITKPDDDTLLQLISPVRSYN